MDASREAADVAPGPPVPPEPMTRPVMRYLGGKWRLAPWIIRHFPPHRVYVEPYGGAGSVLLRKPRACFEVYNDRDEEIVNVFRVLRDPASSARMEKMLYVTPFSRADFEGAFEKTDDAVERARRTIVRSAMGFGSKPSGRSMYDVKRADWCPSTGFRANNRRANTVPAHAWAHYPVQVARFCARLRGVVIECRDAHRVIRDHDGPDTLHYVDPPYVPSTRRGKYLYDMGDEDHAKLLRILMHETRGMVILSAYDHPMYRDALTPCGWTSTERAARADGARPRIEVLWMNPMARERIAADVTARGSTRR